MKIYNRRYESLIREDLDQLKLEQLQSMLNRVYKNVPFYQREMKNREIIPHDVKEIKDLSLFSFTTREDFNYNYPYGLFAVPLRDIVRINSISGIAGKPTVLGYTKNDLDVWIELISRLYVASGITADDIVQISFVYGLSNWGRSMKAAAENIESSVIPMSALNPEKELMIMSDYKTSCLVSTPSRALHLLRLMSELGMDPKKLSLKRGIFVSEPLTEEIREIIERGFGITARTAYGFPESMGPAVAYECLQKKLHVAEDHFHVEIVDPETGEVLKSGEEGELVVTMLSMKAFPLIRFRTGDISRIVSREPCACGRTLETIEMPVRRTDGMLSIQGVKVYPLQIEKIIKDVIGEKPPFIILLYKVRELDKMDILIEEVESLFSDEIKVLEGMIVKIQEDVFEILGIRTHVKLVEHFTMEALLKGENRVIHQ